MELIKSADHHHNLLPPIKANLIKKISILTFTQLKYEVVELKKYDKSFPN